MFQKDAIQNSCLKCKYSNIPLLIDLNVVTAKYPKNVFFSHENSLIDEMFFYRMRSMQQISKINVYNWHSRKRGNCYSNGIQNDRGATRQKMP